MMSEDEIIYTLRGAVVTDYYLHCGTGELLTIWVRLPNGKLASIIPNPSGYKLDIDLCPWSEEHHG